LAIAGAPSASGQDDFTLLRRVAKLAQQRRANSAGREPPALIIATSNAERKQKFMRKDRWQGDLRLDTSQSTRLAAASIGRSRRRRDLAVDFLAPRAGMFL